MSFWRNDLILMNLRLFYSPLFPFQIPTVHLFVYFGDAYVTHRLSKYYICEESHQKGSTSNSSFMDKDKKNNEMF